MKVLRSGVIILNSDLGMGAGRLLCRTSQLEVELSQDQKMESHDRNRRTKQRVNISKRLYASVFFPLCSR